MITHHCSDCGTEYPDGNNLCHPTAAVDSVRHSTPLRDAYDAARNAAEQAEQIYLDSDDTDTNECAGYHADDCQHRALLEAVRSTARTARAARKAWIDSSEPKQWRLIEDGHCYATVEAPTVEDALSQAEDWLSEGDYCENHTVWVDVRVELVGAPDVTESTTVTLHPQAPECTNRTHGHDWRSPYDVVGGDPRNPGVWGHNGGAVITEVCGYCGAYRITDTWAQRPDTGESGLTSVSYRDADEDSETWVAERSAVTAEDESARSL